MMSYSRSHLAKSRKPLFNTVCIRSETPPKVPQPIAGEHAEIFFRDSLCGTNFSCIRSEDLGSSLMTSSAPSLLSRVRDQLHELPPTERRLADLVLDFPGELASYSASELAGLANVSNATVSRFIR